MLKLRFYLKFLMFYKGLSFSVPESTSSNSSA